MDIDNEQTHDVRFSELRAGDVFKYSREFYMVTTTANTTGETCGYQGLRNSVSLSDGALATVGKNSMVAVYSAAKMVPGAPDGDENG